MKNIITRLPEYPVLPKLNQKFLRSYFDVGDVNGGILYLKRIADGDNPLVGVSPKEAERIRDEIKQYFNSINEAKNTDNTIVGTHHKLVYSIFENTAQAIIDEDIIGTLLPVHNIHHSAIKEYADFVRGSELSKLTEVKALVQTLNGLSTYKPVRLDFEKMDDIISASRKFALENNNPILKLLTAHHVMKDVKGNHWTVRKNELDGYDNTILLSATANEFMYRQLFGESLDFIDCGSVDHLGEQIQVSNLSFSRNSMESESYQKRYISKINELLPERPVITFKAFQKYFTNPSDIILENPTGSNIHEGQAITVVGTPHLPMEHYLMIATALGLTFGTADIKLDSYEVQREEWEFDIMSFPHEGLREIQLSMIESNLIQAVGRARTIRHDQASVILFSNFPLSGFEQLDFKEFVGRFKQN